MAGDQRRHRPVLAAGLSGEFRKGAPGMSSFVFAEQIGEDGSFLQYRPLLQCRRVQRFFHPLARVRRSAGSVHRRRIAGEKRPGTIFRISFALLVLPPMRGRFATTRFLREESEKPGPFEPEGFRRSGGRVPRVARKGGGFLASLPGVQAFA